MSTKSAKKTNLSLEIPMYIFITTIALPSGKNVFICHGNNGIWIDMQIVYLQPFSLML